MMTSLNKNVITLASLVSFSAKLIISFRWKIVGKKLLRLLTLSRAIKMATSGLIQGLSKQILRVWLIFLCQQPFLSKKNKPQTISGDVCSIDRHLIDFLCRRCMRFK
jgi:hypothetical protein